MPPFSTRRLRATLGIRLVIAATPGTLICRREPKSCYDERECSDGGEFWFCTPHCSFLLIAAITSCHLVIDLRQGKTPAISKLMKIKEKVNKSRACSRESREFSEFPPIPRIGVPAIPRGETLVEFELLFVDFQGLDAGLEGRWWNSKLSRRPGRPRNPASSLSERRLDNLSL